MVSPVACLMFQVTNLRKWLFVCSKGFFDVIVAFIVAVTAAALVL